MSFRLLNRLLEHFTTTRWHFCTIDHRDRLAPQLAAASTVCWLHAMQTHTKCGLELGAMYGPQNNSEWERIVSAVTVMWSVWMRSMCSHMHSMFNLSCSQNSDCASKTPLIYIRKSILYAYLGFFFANLRRRTCIQCEKWADASTMRALYMHNWSHLILYAYSWVWTRADREREV